MQILSQEEINLIDTSLSGNHPFALILPPGETTPLLWTSTKAPDNINLYISPWLSDCAAAVHNLDDSAINQMALADSSTPDGHYLMAVKKIADRCRHRNGKTVYSRVICGMSEKNASWGERADRLFAQFPDTFRFIYHTPHTLGWLGATPEVLLDFDKTNGRFSTMSLAGTRQYGTDSQWDKKNVSENGFVTNYIVESLRPFASDISVSQTRTLRYGTVEHLLHIISGRASISDIEAIIAAINPTPALCGFPKEDAVNDISELEHHDRNCYGGFIAIDTPQRYTAFVNLRCVQFSGNRFCAYGGGGITAESDPVSEHAETSAKMEKLLSILRTAERRRQDDTQTINTDSSCK